ncbi:hypothetical protein COO60DRAFT_421902 [Scenedesmus sp. NREL 46B-D3]|nr:hypothetical protein COO60DRAFT_421902 [Scenedesmus sp. NREL 46B-D3]
MQTGVDAAESARLCGAQVQRIHCFYDRSRTAIVGVEYTLRGSSHKRSICNTAAPSRETLHIRRGVGVGKLTVSSISSWVVGLDFRLTNGRLASCRASTYALASNSSTSGSSNSSNRGDLDLVTVPRRLAGGGDGAEPSTAAAAAAAVAAPPGAATGAMHIEDFLVNMPGAITDKPRCYPGCRRSRCGARCDQKAARREFVGPDARHVLGAISGVCLDTPGYFKHSLQQLTRPCWVRAALLSCPRRRRRRRRRAPARHSAPHPALPPSPRRCRHRRQPWKAA